MSAVVFDLDDTLYPQVRHVHSGFSAVARALSRRFELPVDRVYGCLRMAYDEGYRGRELQRLCTTFGLNELIVPDLVQIIRSHRPQIFLAHDSADALQTLRARGWRTAILTNGIPSVQAAKARALGLSDLVDHVIFADEHAPGGKPAADAFMEALRRLEAAPQNAVMVGDSRVNDIEGARAVGMRTILIARGEQPVLDGGADAVVNGLTDLPRLALDLVQNRMAHAA
jgi:putative hydrolase of the HAD superfamily